jgi:ElaB/YqjD/DUF883 family membrane-anchored ribosome-binding protein
MMDRKDVEKKAKEIKKDLTCYVEDSAEALSDAGREVNRRLKKLRASGVQKLEEAEEAIREKPFQSMGIAFLVGAAASFLANRGREL